MGDAKAMPARVNSDDTDECGSSAARTLRVAIVASPDKPPAAEALERLRRWLAGRAELVYAGSHMTAEPPRPPSRTC